MTTPPRWHTRSRTQLDALRTADRRPQTTDHINPDVFKYDILHARPRCYQTPCALYALCVVRYALYRPHATRHTPQPAACIIRIRARADSDPDVIKTRSRRNQKPDMAYIRPPIRNTKRQQRRHGMRSPVIRYHHALHLSAKVSGERQTAVCEGLHFHLVLYRINCFWILHRKWALCTVGGCSGCRL
jgi:hypothetical protein